MSMMPESLVLPSDLKESILAGRCVAYIGSGASNSCYLPWRELVTKLCEHCGSGAPRGTSFDDLCGAAEDAKARDVDKYRGFLRCHFGRPIQQTNVIYHALLQCTFKSYLTTNFDPLLAYHARLPGIPSCNRSVMWYPDDLPIGEIGNRTIYSALSEKRPEAAGRSKLILQ